MKKIKLLYYLFALSIFVSSCNSDDDDKIESIRFEQSDFTKEYNLRLGETLKMDPAVVNVTPKTTYAWYLNGQIIAITKELNHIFNEEGTFKLELKVTHGKQEIKREYVVHVKDHYDAYFRPKTENSSPYISEVLMYKPAPGQFLNTNYANEEASKSIVGVADGMVSLGAWGGYIDFKFDHTIENLKGKRDFVVYGNAFNGSSEPGIVQVSFDENGNGIADDQWFEIAGSSHYKSNTVRGYELTYYNPKDAVDVPFKDKMGTEGALKTNAYHTQPYYPDFIAEKDSVKFKGTRLILPHTTNSSGWTVLNNLLYGYSDNYSEEYGEMKGNTIDISWAVDENMEPVKLKGIDFVRVYTGVFGQNDLLGEVSTEIKGAADLSLLE